MGMPNANTSFGSGVPQGPTKLANTIASKSGIRAISAPDTKQARALAQ